MADRATGRRTVAVDAAARLLLDRPPRLGRDPARGGRRAVRLGQEHLRAALGARAGRAPAARRPRCSPPTCWPPGTIPSAGWTGSTPACCGPLADGRPGGSAHRLVRRRHPVPGRWMDVPVGRRADPGGRVLRPGGAGRPGSVSVLAGSRGADRRAAGTGRRPGRGVVPRAAGRLAGRRGRLLRGGPHRGSRRHLVASDEFPPARTGHATVTGAWTAAGRRGSGMLAQ